MDNIKALKSLKKEDWLVLAPFGVAISLFVIFGIMFLVKSSQLGDGFNMWDLSATFLFFSAIMIYLIPHQFYLDVNLKNEYFDNLPLENEDNQKKVDKDIDELKFFEKEK